MQGKTSILALDDFSLEVPQGSFVSLMGPSGCGKSTVTKIIAGIEKADSGQVLIYGKNQINGVSRDIQLKMGYVFQWHNLTEWRTVEENLYFPLEMLGIKKDFSWTERAEKYLNLVGLYKYRKVYPHELSGGMKQRVGIARSLMLEPEILVFDQPFGALDAITRGILANLLSTEMRNQGKTILMITSDTEEAVHYCDYIYVMTSQPGHNRTMLKTNITEDQRKDPNLLIQNDFLALDRKLIQIINSEENDIEK